MSSSSYGRSVAFVYIFNLVVGVGALALPFGVAQSGLVLGLGSLALLAGLSFVTATWVVESVAVTNALAAVSSSKPVLFDGRPQRSGAAVSTTSVSSTSAATADDGITRSPARRSQAKEEGSEDLCPLFSAGEPGSSREGGKGFFSLDVRVEMGKMAETLLGEWGSRIFHVALLSYLFGDLVIYAVAVPRSLLAVTGPLGPLSHDFSYALYLVLFASVITPLSLFTLEKTKYLQMATTFARYAAMIMMVAIASHQIAVSEGLSLARIPLVRFEGLGAIFGSGVYAFMCHHSLSGIVAPVDVKKRLSFLIFADLAAVLFVYSLLCSTAVIAFGGDTRTVCEDVGNSSSVALIGPELVSNASNSLTNSTSTPALLAPIPDDTWTCRIQSLYTLNFAQFPRSIVSTSLQLYPVFTLGASFPLIAITLRNNVLDFAGYSDPALSSLTAVSPTAVIRYRQYQIMSSLAVTLPAFCIAALGIDLGVLVHIVGSFSGVMIQWIVPALLVSRARARLSGVGLRATENPYLSPFDKDWQVQLILLVGISSIIFNAVKLGATILD